MTVYICAEIRTILRALKEAGIEANAESENDRVTISCRKHAAVVEVTQETLEMV